MSTSFCWEAKAGMVHFVSGWTRDVQVKLWNPSRTHAIPERLRDVIMTRRYTNPRLPYLTFTRWKTTLNTGWRRRHSWSEWNDLKKYNLETNVEAADDLLLKPMIIIFYLVFFQQSWTVSCFLFFMSSCGLSTCIYTNMNEWVNEHNQFINKSYLNWSVVNIVLPDWLLLLLSLL